MNWRVGAVALLAALLAFALAAGPASAGGVPVTNNQVNVTFKALDPGEYDADPSSGDWGTAGDFATSNLLGSLASVDDFPDCGDRVVFLTKIEGKDGVANGTLLAGWEFDKQQVNGGESGHSLAVHVSTEDNSPNSESIDVGTPVVAESDPDPFEGVVSVTLQLSGIDDGESIVVRIVPTVACGNVNGDAVTGARWVGPECVDEAGAQPCNIGGKQTIPMKPGTQPPPEPELKVEKTAATESHLTYTWTIDKSVDRKEIALTKDPTAEATYTIEVTRDEGKISGWTLWGAITVSNVGDVTATIASVTDELSDFGDIPVHCEGPEFPVDLEPGNTLNCGYGPIALPNGNERENTATVVTKDGNGAGATGDSVKSDPVDVVFGDPMVINGSVLVTDDYATPQYKGDDREWVFDGSDSAEYTRSFSCKDAGKHVNTATLIEYESRVRELTNIPAENEAQTAQATVNVYCDTKLPGKVPGKDGQKPGGVTDKPTSSVTAPLPTELRSTPAAVIVDPSCSGADAVRGSRGDSAWALISRKGAKTTFFLSKRSHWKVLRLGKKAKNPYYRLGAAYIMVKLHRLNGTTATPAQVKAMNWTRRYMFTHRPGYSKAGPNASRAQLRTVRTVRRVMRTHTATLESYADAIDAVRCTN